MEANLKQERDKFAVWLEQETFSYDGVGVPLIFHNQYKNVLLQENFPS